MTRDPLSRSGAVGSDSVGVHDETAADRLERRGVRADVLHRGESGRHLVPALVALPDVDESVGMVVRKRPNEQRIDDAEDRGRRPDRERERHGAERGERREPVAAAVRRGGGRQGMMT